MIEWGAFLLMAIYLPYNQTKERGGWRYMLAFSLLGIIATIITTAAVLAAFTYFFHTPEDPIRPGQLAASLITFTFWSVIVSPISAYFGYRKHRKLYPSGRFPSS